MAKAQGFEFENLFQGGKIGKIKLRNRIVKPAMGTNYASEDGYVTPLMMDYYSQTAKGGAGLVIVEVACVDSPAGKGLSRELNIDDDKYIEGLGELAKCIKKHGAKAAIQLHHAGRGAKSKQTGVQPVAPSAISSPWGEMPRELSAEEILRVVDNFAKAAKRAKESGFDGVEIHAAHGYLIDQFLSPASNKRQDEYGGALKNRARILLEILHATRELVGKNYPVWCRINGREYGIEDGLTLSEAQEIARLCQKNGADAIDVSAYGYGPEALANLPISIGSLIPLAQAIKNVVTIPVISAGRITPEVGEKALREKRADFIAMGRALLADPDLPQKLETGHLDDIRPCIACLQCISRIIIENEPVRCSVNAAIGLSKEYQIKKAERRKKVCIIGGGPAGMEAARIAALRGHKVVLYEKGDKLGGQLLAALKPPRKERIEPLIDYLEKQVRKLGVKIDMQKDVSPELVQMTEAEAVVLATGTVSITPQVPGLSQFHVVNAEDVLLNNVEIGGKVIIIGGGMVGCETAEFLVDRGKQVTIVEMTKRLASKEVTFIRAELLDSLRRKGVKVFMEAKCEEVTDKAVIVADKGGKKVEINGDTIVLAVGSKPNIELLPAIKGKVPSIYQIGDCVEPRGILEAIDEGFHVGCQM